MAYYFEYLGEVLYERLYLSVIPCVGDCVLVKGNDFKIVSRQYDFDKNVLTFKMERI